MSAVSTFSSSVFNRAEFRKKNPARSYCNTSRQNAYVLSVAVPSVVPVRINQRACVYRVTMSPLIRAAIVVRAFLVVFVSIPTEVDRNRQRCRTQKLPSHTRDRQHLRPWHLRPWHLGLRPWAASEVCSKRPIGGGVRAVTACTEQGQAEMLSWLSRANETTKVSVREEVDLLVNTSFLRNETPPGPLFVLPRRMPDCGARGCPGHQIPAVYLPQAQQPISGVPSRNLRPMTNGRQRCGSCRVSREWSRRCWIHGLSVRMLRWERRCWVLCTFSTMSLLCRGRYRECSHGQRCRLWRRYDEELSNALLDVCLRAQTIQSIADFSKSARCKGLPSDRSSTGTGLQIF